jgi:hypothetical protein
MSEHSDARRMTVREMVEAAHQLGRVRIPGGDDRMRALMAEADRRQRGEPVRTAGGKP